ncbi:hypothetical protein Tco_1505366 [Tanacetum coccineum]
MAVLDSCPKHNMVAYLEKTEGNAEFHEIIDFLTRSSIHHALTDEGASLERPSEAQPTPSPAPTSEVPLEPKMTYLAQIESDKSLLGNEGDMTLQSVYDLCLSLCAQSMAESVSLKQRFPSKRFSKKQRVHKESVSKQGRKFAKGESSVQGNPLFDEIPKDTVDHMETENAQDEGRTREMVDEDKEINENILSLRCTYTDRQIEGTDEQIKGTEEHIEGTEEQVESTDGQREGTEEQFESTDGQRKGTEDHTEEEIAAQSL